MQSNFISNPFIILYKSRSSLVIGSMLSSPLNNASKHLIILVFSTTKYLAFLFKFITQTYVRRPAHSPVRLRRRLPLYLCNDSDRSRSADTPCHALPATDRGATAIHYVLHVFSSIASIVFFVRARCNGFHPPPAPDVRSQ